MANVTNALTQLYHRSLTSYYRASEWWAEFFNLSRRLSLLMLLIGLVGAWFAAQAVMVETWGDWRILFVYSMFVLVPFVLFPIITLHPEWIVVVVTFAVASLISPVFWDYLPGAEMGLSLPNVLVAYGLFLIAIRHMVGISSSPRLWFSPSSWAVLSMLLLSVGAGLVYHTVVSGLSYRKEIAELQHTIMWLLYFLFIGVATDSRMLRRLQIGILAVAFVGSVPTILQALVGEQALFFLKLTQRDIRLERTEGLLRVLPPGENLILVTFLISCQMLSISSGLKRWGWAALTTVYGMAILMTLTRHSWFTALFGLGLFWLFGSTRTKVNTLLIGFIVVVLVVSAAAFVRPLRLHAENDFFAKISRRFISTFHDDPTQHSLSRVTSTGQRTYENKFVLSKLPESPWFGYGWSVKQPVKIYHNPYLGTTTFVPVTYIHNAFWWIVGKGGIVGAAGLLILWITGIVRGYLLYRRCTDMYAKAWLLALWVGFLGLILASQFEP
ncbi:MAG: O-antigen ligase family protein, partial [Armatimonadota bacterium]|nr:O-antigen ligase family protein [Armatimonadota bacterium]